MGQFWTRWTVLALVLALMLVVGLAGNVPDAENAGIAEAPEPTEIPIENGQRYSNHADDDAGLVDEKSSPDDSLAPDDNHNYLGWIDYNVEVLATHLDIPWELVFLPNGDVFITERPGQVRLFRDGELLNEPILEFPDVVHIRRAEGGLLGMTLHPEFEETQWIYFYYTYLNDDEEMRNRVVRYEVDETEFSDRTVIIDDIPGALTHNGGRIKFGPDDKLYIATGDAEIQHEAQNPDVLAAKILRINDDGTFPEDNPYDDSPVYAVGLRNPQGLSWHPETGALFANQHGPTGNDEFNLIEPGNNYGWPDMEGFKGEQKDEFTLPILVSGEQTWAPSGGTFIHGETFPQWQNDYIMAGLRSVTLYRINLQQEEPEMGPIIQGTFGRLRTVVEGPDGYIYVLTSNQDERQSPSEDDDKLFRIVPVE
jgi:aldose sugar dehydrogenase